MCSNQDVLSTETKEPFVQLLDAKPSDPTKECYAPYYEQCHRCKKWFARGDGYYGYNWYAQKITWLHGNPLYGSNYFAANGDIAGHTCPKCDVTSCKREDCPCNGPKYWCQMCGEHKRGIGKGMYNENLCTECHYYFMIGKQVMKILVEKKPPTLGHLYHLLHLQSGCHLEKQEGKCSELDLTKAQSTKDR